MGSNQPRPPVVTRLTSGLPLPDQSGQRNRYNYYDIIVPAGATRLLVATTNGNTSDIDLAVGRTLGPDGVGDGCSSAGYDSNEACTIVSPEAGQYYIEVGGQEFFAGLTVTATVF